ncbi:hypothetical protein GCM10010103_15840 [Streptomyces paradoxus]|uniref:Uncharacterized protein n=1 Tax=Streptomyces paradoxus TaxID=66375 RepID=A0A7W9T7T1_9ACTN|nr:hypothetical protein [Streptomyces paradoxus]MBB6075690.1 hypothetical protein [Streptomyces paradoxus]
MLTEALTALAAAGGTAVVQAAGTDVWGGCRQRVARLFGHGDTQQERVELELDQTAAALEAVGGEEAELTRSGQQTLWRSRFETLLLSLDGVERERAAAELQALVDERAERGGTTVSNNIYYGPAVSQIGDHNEQTNNWGSSA